MKKILSLLLLLLALKSFSQFEEEDSRIVNEFIVLLKPSHTIEQLLSEPAFVGRLTNKKCLSQRMSIYLLERNTISSSEEFLLSLQQNENVKLAQFNHHVKQRSLIPNDPDFSQQWNMLNTGQNGGIAGDDIEATEAWAINHDNVTADGDTVVIAVIDNTFDLNHEDISYFINYNEIPGNSFDDDGNGYIDDYEGWNIFNNNGNVNSIGPDADHSTHCAGIAAAIGNNSKGVAGVCWGAKILPVTGSSNIESEVVAAYDYVRNMRLLYNNSFGTKGAFVVSTNSSFGIDKVHPAAYPIWCAMYDSMGYVGILSAGATANGGWDIDTQGDMPTECPSKYLIAVTNTENNDARNTNAAYGKINVDLGAPGKTIHSTVPSSSYSNMTGTSMATPHVAGAVAAMYAAACKSLIDKYHEQPDTIALLIKKYLLDAAEWVSSLNNITVSSGRLNLLRAITNLKRDNCDSCNFNIGIDRIPISCKGNTDGALAVTVDSGSIFDYSIVWSNSLTTPECVSMSPGFYTVTVRDTITGCRRYMTAELHNPDSIIISAVNIIPPAGGNNGNITINATAGNEPLTYSIDGINFQPTPTFVIDSTGNYTVYVKNSSGCMVQQNIIVSGVKELAFGSWQIAVYPNPANNVLNIFFNTNKNSAMKFSITNVLGENVFETTKEISAGIHTASLDISILESGVYFIGIESATEKLTRKFIVNN